LKGRSGLTSPVAQSSVKALSFVIPVPFLLV
jgi:hypothetical protein